MKVAFQAISEPAPGPKWQAQFQRHLDAYRRWFLKEGDAARPTYAACARALRKHMPELVNLYDQLVELAGGGDLTARLLSLYRPTPYLTGCSQAVWTRDVPFLVRNYDYHPNFWDATLWHTAWNSRKIIAMSDCMWGILDGINEAGLCVSLAFGGRKAIGDGFGIPLVLRYDLQCADSLREAVAILGRVPSHMTYNVTVLDAAGEFATVYVSPDRPAVVTRRGVATNHQGAVEWRQFAHATASIDRERFLIARRADAQETRSKFSDRFLQPPIYSTAFRQGWGTLYTVRYEPKGRLAEFRWATHALRQGFDDFSECAFSITYGSDTTPKG